MAYNKRDLPVLTQDGNQRALGRWLGVTYDDYGRPVTTGFATSTGLDATTSNPTIATLLTQTDYSTVTSGIELGKVKTTHNFYGTYLESFLEYDNYGRVLNSYSNNQLYTPIPGTAISSANFSEKVAITYDLADNVLTKTRTHKPDANTTRTILETIDYDNGLRVKQMKHQVDNLPEQILSSMNYTVKNQVATKYVGKTGSLNFLQKIDYAYNDLGWLTGINPTGVKGVQTPFANCTIPGTNTTSTTDLDVNDLFSMDFKYESPTTALTPGGTPAAKAEYGGNITQMAWQVRGREKQVYTFQYDYLNRMTDAHYAEVNAGGNRTNDLDKYMEQLTYDVRGNIQTLKRKGVTNNSCVVDYLIDDLTYNYIPKNPDGTPNYNGTTNRLQQVTDAADLMKGFKSQANGGTYTYDANGNLKTDPNKGITNIVYNHLNLPELITFNTGNSIAFSYDASGTKLRKTTNQGAGALTNTIAVTGVPANNSIFNAGFITSTATINTGITATMTASTSIELQPGFLADQGSVFSATIATTGAITHTQDYVGGIEYKDGIFEAIYHAEGRVTTVNGSLKYEYAFKDHLGNTRLMFCDKNGDGLITQAADQEASEVTQENHFYPFGLNMEGVWQNAPSIVDNKYQYNGKELVSDFGLELNDYGARNYDAAIGRWNAVDPMSEKYGNWSPYNYTKGNPINMIDPNGMEVEGQPTAWGQTYQGYAAPDQNGEVHGTTKGTPDKVTVLVPDLYFGREKDESGTYVCNLYCNIDKYKMDEGGEYDPRRPVIYHSFILDLKSNTLKTEISDFVDAIDCGAGGKLNNIFYIEIGYNLQDQRFNSAEKFNLAKQDWIKQYINGVYDTDLKATIRTFMDTQTYSFFGNKTLSYPDVGIANKQHNAARNQLLQLGIPDSNIRSRFNHSQKSSSDLYMSISPNPILFQFLKKVPIV